METRENLNRNLAQMLKGGGCLRSDGVGKNTRRHPCRWWRGKNERPKDD